jgi:branched-chain amino acid transport system substrate-binding protein
MLSVLNESSKTAGQDLTADLINSQVVPSPDDIAYPMVVNYRAQVSKGESRGKAGFIGLEGWLNAVVVSEALRRAGSNPSRADFILAMESLGGWDPGLGVKLGFSSSNHQGMHKVWLTKSEQGQWRPEANAGPTP